jgi:competence protein ComFC
MRFLLETLLAALYPWVCPLCGREGSPPTGACRPCLGVMGGNPAWRCLSCGRPLGGVVPLCCGAGDGRLDGLFAAVEYGPEARRAVHLFKYARDARAGRMVGEMLAAAVGDGFDVPIDLVIPVPLAAGRLRERGFNQSALMARRIGRRLERPVGYRTLERARETPAQADLDPPERRSNVAGAFRVTRSPVAGSTVLLVDDVYTTGATIGECARVLRSSGASHVFGAVFACSPLRSAAGY